MGAIITDDVLKSFLDCRRKAFLKFTGETGIRHEFELLQEEITAAIRQRVAEGTVANNRPPDVLRGVALTPSVLKSGSLYLLDVTLATDEFTLNLDGLKLVSGDAGGTESHYVPILCCPQRHARKKQKLLLALYAVVLGAKQGCDVNTGLACLGPNGRLANLSLTKQLSEAERTLQEMRHVLKAGDPPALLLNDHCSICEYQKQCEEQAVKADNISLLRALSEKEIKAYSRKGILTVTQLAHTFRPRRKGKRAGVVNRRYHSLQAMAVRDNAVYVLGIPELPSNPVSVYLDVESDPETNSTYLIGAIVDTGTSQEAFSFWANNVDEEGKIYNAFLNVISDYEDFAVFAYGAHEKRCFTKMRASLRRKRRIDDVLQRLVNTLSLVYSHIYFPVYSNSLKDIGRHMGCTWSAADPSGLQCFVWRTKWEETRDAIWKERIISYNMEDCQALKTVTEFSRRIGEQAGRQPTRLSGTDDAFTWVQDLDNLVRPKRWGPVDFFHADFDAVNKCAYFDYQRERVYARSSKMIRTDVTAKHKRCGKRHNATLRVTERIDVKSVSCPRCKRKNLVRGLKGHDIVDPPADLRRPRVKRVFDLVVTSSGIKRKVIECRTSVHQCRDCGNVFVPWRHQRLAKHYHGLMSWVMYQHVAHRISGNRIVEMLKDFFGLQVSSGEIVQIKSQMAGYYNILSASAEIVFSEFPVAIKLRSSGLRRSPFFSMEA